MIFLIWECISCLQIPMVATEEVYSMILRLLNASVKRCYPSKTYKYKISVMKLSIALVISISRYIKFHYPLFVSEVHCLGRCFKTSKKRFLNLQIFFASRVFSKRIESRNL